MKNKIQETKIQQQLKSLEVVTKNYLKDKDKDNSLYQLLVDTTHSFLKQVEECHQSNDSFTTYDDIN